MNQQTYNSQVDARAQQMLTAICERSTDYSHWNLHACMHLAPDPTAVTQTIRRTLWRNAEVAAADLMGGPFEILPAALIYSRWQDVLTDEARTLLRDYLTGAHFERGNTENHWLMYYAGLLLAWLAVRFSRSGERSAFRRFFLLTLLYLPVVLTVLAIDWQ